ncbi:prepilin-type N-terminal cleavage/methylation domain-containing protein [Piscinibacter sakaiensis]|uniref:prepilin-type N-terminal cleavage/methylation domain-containing protein n=1 Tax=Piscinibacter sakaiensis TaxID=1547922 RepID=UPI00372C714D
MGRRTADPQPRGFTLIEMMVVLVLLGLVTTLALPAVQRWHDGLQLRAQGMGIVEALRAAAFAAGASRRDLVMDRDSFSAAATAAPMPAASGPAPRVGPRCAARPASRSPCVSTARPAR